MHVVDNLYNHQVAPTHACHTGDAMFRFALCSLTAVTAVTAVLSGCAAPGPSGGPYSTAAINAAAAAATANPPVAAPAPRHMAPAAPAPSAVVGSTPCAPINESQVAQLFDRWNASLMTHDPRKVVENYAPHSILLPTVSNKPRYSVEDKIDYFVHFLHDGPMGKIDQRFIQVGCNTALDAGLYTFTFFKTGAMVHARYSYTYGYINGQWLITSHHSSGMPEKPPAAAPALIIEHEPAKAPAAAKKPAPAKAPAAH